MRRRNGLLQTRMKSHNSSNSFGTIEGSQSRVEEKGKHESLVLDETEEEELCGNGMSGLGEKKQRLRVDQVKALEADFQLHIKLDPERKQRLARHLGLQPRQVAVWFQNHRARRKTKQLERDCGSLRARHDALKLRYDALHSDNEFLQSQIRELEAMLEGKAGEGKRPSVVDDSSDSDSSVLFNGEAVVHEHCLSECRTQFPSAGGRGYLDEDLVSGEEHGSSFFSRQPAKASFPFTPTTGTD